MMGRDQNDGNRHAQTNPRDAHHVPQQQQQQQHVPMQHTDDPQVSGRRQEDAAQPLYEAQPLPFSTQYGDSSSSRSSQLLSVQPQPEVQSPSFYQQPHQHYQQQQHQDYSRTSATSRQDMYPPQQSGVYETSSQHRRHAPLQQTFSAPAAPQHTMHPPEFEALRSLHPAEREFPFPSTIHEHSPEKHYSSAEYQRGASESSSSSSYPATSQVRHSSSQFGSSQPLAPSFHQSLPESMETRPMVSAPGTLSWRPRASRAQSPTGSMFGERLQQRAQFQQGNIPHIPNIVVDPVPVRDTFGHSRTPPFVQSDWASQWGLTVPSSNKKMRTNSDSAIYEAEKAQQQQEQHTTAARYIPSSWELLSFHQSQPGSEDVSQKHIRAETYTSSSPSSVMQQDVQAGTYQHRSQHSSTIPSATASKPPEVQFAMETASPSPEEREETMEALDLQYKPPLSSPKSTTETSKPTVPFLWKFHVHKSGKSHGESPKTYWLRRHSDSTLPTEPEDLSIPKSQSARSRSTGDKLKAHSISEEKTDVESGIGATTGSSATTGSTSGAEGGDIPSPKEPTGTLLSKRLKLKKYLQKRYQLSLESTSSRHSTESDDVFSPSPGVFGSSQGFTFSPTLVEGEISPQHPRPSPLAATEQSRQPSDPKDSKKLTEPLEIKTEPISPISSESDPDTDAGVFLSPAFASPQSASPRSHASVFQFHSPGSYRSSGSEKSTDSRAEFEIGHRSDITRHSSSPGVMTPGPHAFPESTSPSAVPMETSASTSSPTSTSHPPSSPPTMEILRQGRLPPLASMLSHPSFTHPNMPSMAAPPTPPFMTYQTSKSQQQQLSSQVSLGWTTSTAITTSSAPTITPARTRSASESEKPQDPSKIIYCPFSEKVQEQRYQREMTFLCPVCGQMFPSYNYLANHMVNHLPSEVVTKGPGDSNKVHLCKVCNRSFSRSDMLTRHMRLHTGLRPYECRVCGQVFSRSDHLHTHLRTHTGEKPYRCPQCPYAAPRRDMITRHMRIHTKHFSRRGRRSSSTGSGDTPQSSSFSSLESGDSDIKKRNQSLSSVGSEGSTDASPYRRSSGTSMDTVESDVAQQRHWSLTSGDSLESGGDMPVSTPTRKPYARNWSLTSIESVEVPQSLSSSPQRSPQQPQPSASLQPLLPGAHRSQRTMSADSGGTTEESRLTPSASTESGEHIPEMAPATEHAEMQSSFQKCHVGSDKESSGSDKDVTMSPGKTTASPQTQS